MERTLALIEKAQNGDLESKDTLIKENMGLIWSVVRRFTNRGYEADDLFQIGAIGLLKCINKFDKSFDVKFSTYAVPMIIGEIRRFIRDDGMIKVSRPLKEIAMKAKYVQQELNAKNGKMPTIGELAVELCVPIEDLVAALDASREVESLYATIYQGDGSPVYLIDKLDRCENSDNSLVDGIVLRQAIDKLKPKERQIVMMRYFDDKTQTEIAKEIGVSQVQVSRIEKKVLKTMRETLENV